MFTHHPRPSRPAERTAAPRRRLAAASREPLRGEELPGSASAARVDASVVGNGVSAGGSALDPALRSYFEPRFGHDFGAVRVHTSPRADASSRAMNAHAYTVGKDIVFRAGAYAPETGDGRRLLAHELAHVVQQQAAGATPLRHDSDAGRSPSIPVSDPKDPAEQDADRVADAVVSAPRDLAFAARPPRSFPASAVIQREAAGKTGKAAPEATERPPGTLWARAADGTPLPPSLEDISQGGLNDCFLFGALAAIVSADPQRIKNMFIYNPDGSYSVVFKGIGFFSSAKQKVTADFVVGKHGNVGPRRALWPLVIEKAYAQEKGGLNVLDKGGVAGSVIDDLLNDSASSFDPKTKPVDYIMGKLAKAKEKRWPMTISTPKPEAASQEAKDTAKSQDLKYWHTYAIVDVDAKTNFIKLFNPWGNSHPNGSGWIHISAVRKFFTSIEINN